MATQSPNTGIIKNHPIQLFSCDTHVEHWPTVLKDHIPDKFHDFFETAPYKASLWGVQDLYGPKGVNLGVLSGYGKMYEVRQGTIDTKNGNIPGASGGPKEYVEWLDIDGVQTALLHPGTALGSCIGMAKGTKDKDTYLTFIRGYNNWLSDFCSEYPDRLAGAAMIPSNSIDDAIAEMKRVRDLPGIISISPGSFPNGSNSPLPDDDRFWAATLEANMPITLHGGISSPMNGFNTPQDAAAWIIGHVEITTGGPFSASQLIMSGVFDRFPELRFIVLECGAGWLPFCMQQMDHFYDRQRFWAGIDLKNPPSWYCTSGNLVWNLISDRVAIEARDVIGVGNLTWCSDFPHGNAEFPYSRAKAMQLCAGLTDQERHDILWANAARFYGLE
jgi:predicted TIM-barrel fold metal-dependent hydrolase